MKVQVFNLNEYPYKEKFKGKEVNIPPMGFVEMEHEDAIMFKGTMNSIVRDADGNPLPQSYKMIRIVKDKRSQEAILNKLEEQKALVCQACGYKAINKKDLEIHSVEEHDGMLLEDESAKKRKAKKSS